MTRLLIVVDLQKDFINGTLGTPEAEAMIPAATQKIVTHKGDVLVTMDTHQNDYLHTQEGQNLPVVHCIKNTEGWTLHDAVLHALEPKHPVIFEKPTFGSVEMADYIAAHYDPAELEIELIGLCTDICVVSNALLLKARFPETPISGDAACCAGVTPESHLAALTTMRLCQIYVHRSLSAPADEG